MSAMSHPDHPIWAIIKWFLSGLIMLGVLGIMASEFDKTEWYAVGAWMASTGSLMWIWTSVKSKIMPPTEHEKTIKEQEQVVKDLRNMIVEMQALDDSYKGEQDVR